MDEAFDQIVRELTQRLESLRRAGLDRVPVGPLAEFKVFRPSGEVESRPARERPAALPASPPVERRPAPPAPVPASAKSTPAAASSVPASLFGEAVDETSVLSREERVSALDALRAEVCVCERCPHLASQRTQTVFGEGNPTARLMFVGEAPGADEDRTGRPFVGRAGMLLTDMITKGMGLTREEVYIANVLKSRPPENRTPTQEEIETCRPFLIRQIEIIQPQFLCLLGRVAVTALLETAMPLGRLRGKWHRYKGIPTIVTYHPSYLLRNPPSKKDAWEDLQMLMGAMGLKIPGRNREA